MRLLEGLTNKLVDEFLQKNNVIKMGGGMLETMLFKPTKKITKAEQYIMLFEKCKNKLQIVTTDSDSELWNNKKIIDNLEQLSRDYIDIRMIYDPRMDLNKTPKIKEMINTGKIRAVKSI